MPVWLISISRRTPSDPNPNGVSNVETPLWQLGQRARCGERSLYCDAPGMIFTRSESARFREDVPTYKDRKSTRLNSSHSSISYAVFCLKKKKKKKYI